MSWALPLIEKLRRGETVRFRPRGNSMHGKIESGQLVTVEPVSEPKQVNIRDAVLCKVNGKYYLHLVMEVLVVGDRARFRIGNMRRFANGWTSAANVYGRVVEVQP